VISRQPAFHIVPKKKRKGGYEIRKLVGSGKTFSTSNVSRECLGVFFCTNDELYLMRVELSRVE
jgi:hypothetical protein